MEVLNKYVLKNNYGKYSKFNSVKEFNKHFEMAMYNHKDKFTKSEHEALNKLRKFAYSKKSPNTIGVAWSRAQVVADAIGISRSTFHRMLRKAKKLNLIKVINQFNKNKYKKHNVYVFNRVNELTPEKFEIVEDSNTIDTTETANSDTSITLILELPRLKEIYNTYSQAENVNVDNVVDKEVKEPETKPEPKTDYQRVKAKISNLFKDKNMTYRIFGVWLAQTNKMRRKPSISLALEALHILVGEIKRRIACELEPLKKPVGFFNGILKNLIQKWNDEQFEVESYALFESEDAIRNGDLQYF